jgi:hypothetical protein
MAPRMRHFCSPICSNLLHDEEGPVEPGGVLLEPERLRDRDLALVKREVGVELVGAVGVDQASGRVAPQDQPAHLLRPVGGVARAQAVRLARRAPVDPLDLLDLDVAGLGHPMRQVARDSLPELLHRRHCGTQPRAD